MNRYEPLKLIKPGNVTLVKDTITGKLFIKKVLSEPQAEIYQRLKQKKFSGIPEITDIYPEYGCYTLIEEYVNGKTLQELIDTGFKFTSSFIYDLVAFLCRTLAPIHRMGIIHRDISFGNIIYSHDGEFYLIDFGNARTYKTGQSSDTEFIGTPQFAAPEQYGYAQSDKRTDIYAIGKIIQLIKESNSYVSDKNSFNTPQKKCTELLQKDRYRNLYHLRYAMFWDRYLRKIFNIKNTVLAILIFTVLFALLSLIPGGNSDNTRYAWVEPLTRSELDERPKPPTALAASIYKVEDYIADKKSDEARQLLDEIKEPISVTGYDTYFLLYSQSYGADGKYNEAAQILFEYLENYCPDSTTPTAVYKRLEYLLPYCTDEDIKAHITQLLQSLEEN